MSESHVVSASRTVSMGRPGRFAVAMLAATALGAAHGAASADLFGLVDTGEIFASTDEGMTWDVRGILPSADAVGLIAGSTPTTLLLATSGGDVHESTDGGVTWTRVGAVTASDVAAVVAGPAGGVLLLTRTGPVFRSVDGGRSFDSLATIGASDLVSMTSTADGLHAAAATGEIYESGDGGAVWSLTSAVPVSDAVEIAGGGELYLMTGTGDTWSRESGGNGWQLAGTVSQVHMSSLLAMSGGDLFATTRAGEIAVSSDGGASWSWIGAINQMNVVALASDEPVTGVGVDPRTARGRAVSPVWPNPAPWGSDLHLRFVLPRSERLELHLLDASGRRIDHRAILMDSGVNEISWAPRAPAAGTYFLRIETGAGGIATRKWVVLS